MVNKKWIGLVFALAWPWFGMAQSAKSYLVTDFAWNDFRTALDLCHQGGFEYLLHRSPFSTYGHYEWNPDFAPRGDGAVAQMVQEAASEGVSLGVFVHADAISTNDAFFAPRYHSQLLRQGEVRLFDDVNSEQRDMAVYKSEVLKNPSTLNLLLVDGELISYGTMEPAGDLMLLHHCLRGVFGTRACAHSRKAPVHKVSDSSERYVFPDGVLVDTVRQHLTKRINGAGITFVEYAVSSGHELLNESQRVQNVERWSAQELATTGEPLMLGWFPVRVSDKRQASTTLVDLEWVLSKAAAFNAGYGLVIDRVAMRRYGQLDQAMALVEAWNTVRDAGVLTEKQKEELSDPYADWHLEPFDNEGYLLFPIHQSRSYRCAIPKAGPCQETWQWKADETSAVALRIEVKGEGEILYPMLATATDTLAFPCVVRAGEFLLCDFQGVARVTNADYHTLQELPIERMLTLDEGNAMVTFSCEARGNKKLPEVSVRYLVREAPTTIHLQ